jgi:hypothetical protein
MNPLVIPKENILGHFDENTGVFIDGILTKFI